MVTREEAPHTRCVRGLCVGRNNRHTYTLVRGRIRCDSAEPGSPPGHPIR